MKRYMLMAVACIMALSAGAQKKLVILHTNDTHSTVMPLSENLNDTMKAGRGGYLRRIEMLKKEREACPDLLLFDSGDFSQGSPYYTMYKGDVEVGLMNIMRYDAATIGNHEFDFGLDNLARLYRKAEFPIVCANYDFSGTVAEGLVKPYVVLERSGLRIGVFGLSPKPGGLISEKNYPGVKFTDPLTVAPRIAAHLKNKEKCDVVVCLSHLGWDLKCDVDDNAMIAASKDIDIVLGGHSHSYFKDLEWVKDAAGHKVPVDQNGKHGIYVGKITMTIQNKR